MRKLPYMERVVIEVNGRCNYRCRMCPQAEPGRPDGFLRRMRLDHFEALLEQCHGGIGVVNLEGSGEPTLNRDLHRYVAVAKKHAERVQMFTNGRLFTPAVADQCFEAGLDYVRFSVIGYDRQSYLDWMRTDAFDKVWHHASEALRIGGRDRVASYHLILNPTRETVELKRYIENWIDRLDIQAEVWRMHNWSGVYDPRAPRQGERKSCGRPFSPDLVIRAGGNDGKLAAVHPCCQVLGRDAEAVLGHASERSLADIYYGPEYEALREAHRTGDYPSYCRNCDFLIDDPHVLVWTNYDRALYQMHGTSFSLEDHRP